MAKIKLIDSYKQAVVKRDTETNEVLTTLDGKPVYERDARGKIRFTIKFLYGWNEWEEDELDLYKDFKAQDGADYYRESDGGVPYYHSDTHFGMDAVIEGYTREDGRIGFAVKDTDASIIRSQMDGEFADFPEIRAELGRKLLHILSAGTRMDVKAKEKELAAIAEAKAKEQVKSQKTKGTKGAEVGEKIDGK